MRLRQPVVTTNSDEVVFLLRGCLDRGSSAEWEGFVHRVHGTVACAVLRAARRWTIPTSEMIDAMVEAVFLRMRLDDFAVLRRFRGNRPEGLLAYLRTVAFEVVQDDFLVRHVEQPAPAGAPMLVGRTLPMERDVLFGRIDTCLREGPAFPGSRRARQLFWMYYRHGLTARATAEIPFLQLSQQEVENTIRQLTRRTQDSLAGNTGVRAAEAPGGSLSLNEGEP
ncbi:MAG TPA: hypothetical protein VG675_01850 [Bryobacteraceae bacterium]|nr:hypothetical protein [Bryobacteraceae bacterium]